MRIFPVDADIQGAIFDFDGTLMDSMTAWSDKLLHLLQAHHVSYPPDIIRILTPMGNDGVAAYCHEQLGMNLSTEAIQRELDDFALPLYRDEILPKPGVEKLLRQLAAAGVPNCILTASPHCMIDPCLVRNGFTSLFRFAWCCDELGLNKTQPAIFQKTCAALGSAPENTVFFDDNLLALTTAAGAGLVTVGVYDPSAADDEGAIRAVCTRYIRRWDELTD